MNMNGKRNGCKEKCGGKFTSGARDLKERRPNIPITVLSMPMMILLQIESERVHKLRVYKGKLSVLPMGRSFGLKYGNFQFFRWAGVINQITGQGRSQHCNFQSKVTVKCNRRDPLWLFMFNFQFKITVECNKGDPLWLFM